MPETFGLWSECPEDKKIAWGARTIIDEHGGEYKIDLVWDRQSTRGAEEHRNELQAFCEKLNNGVLRETFSKAVELLQNHEMMQHEDKLFTLFDKDGVKVLGDTNGSCGYLYLIAFPTEDEDEG